MIDTDEFPKSIHDASLLKINFSLDNDRVVRNIDIQFIDEGNRYIDSTFFDVFKYEFLDFLHQNIIFDVDIYRGNDKITQYFQNEDVSINLKGLESASYEMSVFSSSIGFNGFVIYKSKKISGPYRD